MAGNVKRQDTKMKHPTERAELQGWNQNFQVRHTAVSLVFKGEVGLSSRCSRVGVCSRAAYLQQNDCFRSTACRKNCVFFFIPKRDSIAITWHQT